MVVTQDVYRLHPASEIEEEESAREKPNIQSKEEAKKWIQAMAFYSEMDEEGEALCEWVDGSGEY